MKERPILFSAPMVRAILDGRKTVTRRVVKRIINTDVGACIKDSDGMPSRLDMAPCNWDICPYGQPGDRLWVREAWRIGAWDENEGVVALDYCDGPREEWLLVPDGEVFERLWQQSTDDAIKALGSKDRYRWEPGQSPCRQRPPIHMPRWASRIDLEIVAVRVERLQDISLADALAEGVNVHPGHHGKPRESRYSPFSAYRDLWESINGTESWDVNPWVWVLEFKRVKP